MTLTSSTASSRDEYRFKYWQSYCVTHVQIVYRVIYKLMDLDKPRENNV